MSPVVEAGRLVAELLGPAGRVDPSPTYRQLHRHGPAVSVPGPVTLVIGYAAVASALRDPRLLVEDAAYLDLIAPTWRTHRSREVLNRAMIFANDTDHDRMRRLVRRAFTARRVDDLAPSIARRAAGLLDRMAELGGGHATVDFIAEFAFLMPVNVICDLLGVPESDRAGLRRPITALADAIEPGWGHADLTASDVAAHGLAEYFGELVAERRSHPRADLLSAVIDVNAGADDRLNDDELVANVVFLLLAGFETTVGLLGNSVPVLLDRPAALARLRGDPRHAAKYVEEILRYEATVQLTGRRAGVALELGGVPVAAGDSVIVAMGAANRDPRRFADPDRFDPARSDNRPLSFGGGTHYCLGARLARLEARLALPMLFGRFPGLALAGTPTRLERFNLRAYETLPLTL